MESPKPFRQKPLEALAEGIRRGTVEHFLSGAIEEQNVLIVIDSNDGVNCRVDDSSQAGLNFEKGVLRMLHLADVPCDFGKANDVLGYVVERRDRDPRLKSRPVLSNANSLFMKVACSASDSQLLFRFS